MSTNKIPEKTIITCDSCQRECGNETHQVPRVLGGGFRLNRHLLDWHNMPCADGTISRDLCDSCLERVSTAVNAEVVAIRKALADAADLSASKLAQTTIPTTNEAD